MEFFNSNKFIVIMVCILICAGLVGCGFKPKVGCSVNQEAETLEQLGKDCVQRPELGVTKDF
jgi:hypothetical protein|tara:strand:+ start:1104 stop:1289 length:186 start_codon:yes stop_codon:yes gene_type:complete